MDKKLEVRNLKISFRTNNGTVKAVRDISFDLDKGETLAIVGESGSGKSVTAKAILGILAGNAIVEGGEIIYDGQDLLKYTEEDFNKIRGNKITMIFQDPLSSLDPIVKIGSQMTEATILNGKTNRKNAAKDFKLKISQLKEAMEKSCEDSSKVNQVIAEFEKMVEEGSKLLENYNTAKEYTESAILSMEALHTDVLKKDEKLVTESMKQLDEKLDKVYDEFMVPKEDSGFQEKNQALHKAAAEFHGENPSGMQDAITDLKELLIKCQNKAVPDLFAIGYYRAKEGHSKEAGGVTQLNQTAGAYVEQKFLKDFMELAAKGLEYADSSVVDAKKSAIALLKENRAAFETEKLDAGKTKQVIEILTKSVDASINKLDIHKDSAAYTFHSTMTSNYTRYFKGMKKNPKELARVERQEAKRQKKLQKKSDVGKVVPAVLVDLDVTKKNMVAAIDELVGLYEKQLTISTKQNYQERAAEMVNYLKDTAYAMVYKVTKQMAYDKAIRIMEDVGIAEPRTRFTQYPFEFSGGMRQRIVIAIAIAANPDVLICDEPTTALDVTIQSQILELINDLKVRKKLTVIFITHDLGVVANMADKVAVMYAGKIVENGTVDEIFYDPRHPYTWALLSSMPDLDTKDALEAIPGTPPNMIYPPKGDAFALRNKYAMEIDFEEEPPMFQITDTHYAATWLLHPNAPKLDPPKSVTDRIQRMKKMEEVQHEG